MRWQLLIFIIGFVRGDDDFVCYFSDGDEINGPRLAQSNFFLSCWKYPNRFSWVETTCRVGINTTTDYFHLVTLEKLRQNNSVSCAFDNSSWEMNDIDIESSNEKTFLNGSENQYVDVYFGQGPVFIIYNLKTEILKLTNTLSYYRSFIHYKVQKDDSIISRIELGDFFLRIHLTPITTRHAGIWEVQEAPINRFEYLELRRNISFIINVQFDRDNSTCVMKNSLSTIQFQCDDEKLIVDKI